MWVVSWYKVVSHDRFHHVLLDSGPTIILAVQSVVHHSLLPDHCKGTSII